MAALWSQKVESAGFAIVPGVFGEEELAGLGEALADLEDGGSRGLRGGRGGVRNLLRSAAIRELTEEGALLGLARTVLGTGAWPVKATLFAKSPTANWKVPWHQDVTIAVCSRCDAAGFGSWTEKDGVPHVQAPAEVLEGMLALRLHLDPCPAENGALRVLPGSHRLGRIRQEDREALLSQSEPVICEARAGDVLVMRPLLLHASSPSRTGADRRVLHVEYAAADLPGGLKWQGYTR